MSVLCKYSVRFGKLSRVFSTLKSCYFTRKTAIYCARVSASQLIYLQLGAFRRNMSTLESLRFDNLALRTLPIDAVKENYVRQVSSSCFSLVDPTPVNNPEIVLHSESAMNLLDLGHEQIERSEFVEYFSGNKKLPGSETASQCYCGHQFGSFAGQLGDGAAIYLGEIVNNNGERWEIQLKGSGKTPYSRQGDGRKVLRSSIREFLCSEAMHHLGIATTRAGCCITSDTMVIRDIFYDGNPIYEKSSIVLRIAPTFMRFGSFEIFKSADPLTGRRAPSAGQKDILIRVLEYIIKTFYPQIHEKHAENAEERYLAFYREVVVRTACLVADWQCVGFCHGVLNTDNMSIMGLTIDYGPFGFMDHFNRDYVCNASDNMGRYSYAEQPEVCKWNLSKLAEAISDALPLSKAMTVLEEIYDKEFKKCYMNKMRKKLGIIHKEDPSDGEFVEKLLQTMEETGADFTNVFRVLSQISIQDSSDFLSSNKNVVEYILSQCLAPSDLPKDQSVSGQMQLLLMLMNSNPAIAAQFEGNSWVQAERERMEKTKKLQETSPEEKRDKDKKAWLEWLEIYRKRVMVDFDGLTDDIRLLNKARVEVMNKNNPRFVLRNYIAENAIKAAEKGDYSVVRNVLSVLQSPYSDDVVKKVDSEKQSEKVDSGATVSEDIHLSYDCKPPNWGLQLRVT